MKIRIKVQSETPHPMKDIDLDSSVASLVPQVNDQIVNSMTATPLLVKARVFEYKQDEILVTLVCAYS
jgi:hypothetical protein